MHHSILHVCVCVICLVVHMFMLMHLVLIGADLRDLKLVEDRLNAAGMDWSIPTLLLSECVLVYVEPKYSDAIINWANGMFTGGSVFVTYEQIRPNDPFGQTMLKNLRSRGCSLKGTRELVRVPWGVVLLCYCCLVCMYCALLQLLTRVRANRRINQFARHSFMRIRFLYVSTTGLLNYPDLESQRRRFLSRGWDRHAAWDMNDIYKYYLDRADVKRYVHRLALRLCECIIDFTAPVYIEIWRDVERDSMEIQRCEDIETAYVCG